MTFLRKLFSWDYYLRLLSGTEKFHALWAAALLSLIVTISPSITLVRDVYPLTKNLESKVLSVVSEVYPDELTITIKKGIASTNVTEPYYLTVRKELLDNFLSISKEVHESQSRIRLLTIDTKAKAEDFERYQTYALLTQTSFVYFRDGKINISSLRDVQDMELTKAKLITTIKDLNKDNKITSIISLLVLISPLLIFLAALLFFLNSFLFVAMLAYFFLRLNQLKVPFGKIYRYAAALAFLPYLIQNVLPYGPVLKINLSGWSFLFDYLIVGLVYYGIARFKQRTNENST